MNRQHTEGVAKLIDRAEPEGGLVNPLSFTILYIALATPLALRARNNEFLFYIAVMTVLAGGVWSVSRWFDLSKGALWALSLLGLLHMLGGLLPVPSTAIPAGETPVLYNYWIVSDYLRYDHLLHAYGYGTLTGICLQALRRITRRPHGPPDWQLLFFAGVTSVGFGALNEVVEFIATRLFSETNVGGYQNTGWDLVANAVGAGCGAVLLRLASRGKKVVE